MVSIRLDRFVPAYKGESIGYLLEVKARATGMTSQIFIYHRGPVDPETNEFQDIYEAVCSPAQLDEIPPNRPYTPPDGPNQIPYYRTDTIKFVCRTVDELDELWQIVQDDVRDLVDAMNRMEDLRSIDSVDVQPSGDVIVNTPIQVVIDLVAQPAGTNGTAADKQVITSPNPALPGWLPVASVPVGWTVPGGAKFFYNIDQHPQLKAYFPLTTPEAQLIFLTGVWLTYGINYVIDAHTIWWLDDDEGKAPWPSDWISPSDPGSYVVSVKLYLTGQQLPTP